MKKTITILLALTVAASLLGARTYSSIVPRPLSIEPGEGQLLLQRGAALYASPGLDFEAASLRDRLAVVFAFDIPAADTPSEGGISLILTEGYGPEAYSLSVDTEGVRIEASASAGIFYGVQTLLQMLPPAVYGETSLELTRYALDAVTVDDSPRYGYRGTMLDVSRTFFDTEHVLRLIDWMAAHKLNRFHWHLADDNGWRIEIRKYPELTEKGAWRGDGEVSPAAYGQGHGRYGGYYTQKEIRQVVEYAAQRHIEIIPEIDLPGHSRSLVGVFPDMACPVDVPYISANGETDNVLCVAREENYRMLRDIFKGTTARTARLWPGSRDWRDPRRFTATSCTVWRTSYTDWARRWPAGTR